MNKLSTLINLHTYEDEYQDTVNALGFLYDDINDVLYFHKGIDINYLRKLLINVEFTQEPFHPYRDMKFEFEEIISPRDEDQVDCINFIAGMKSHSSNTKDSQIFLVKSPGFGKALPYNTKIPTPKGIRRFGTLDVGDEIFDEYGQPTKILQIYEQGIQPIWKITFKNGMSTYCTRDHLWLISRKVSLEQLYRIYINAIDYLDSRDNGFVIPTYKLCVGSMIPRYNFKDDSISWLEICNIEETSQKENCRCIMVENDSHLFLTNDGIVTHNTYCAGYGIGLYGVKTLIVMHRDNLRTQWLNSLYNMNGYSDKEVHEITSSAEFESIVNNTHGYDYDIYLMTHSTFRAGVKRVQDPNRISKFTENLGIGLKVIDEAHLEFRDTLLMDFLFNVKRNLYLTATDGRSSRDENAIFRHVFSNTTFYKKASVTQKKHPDKWVEYITVNINTHVKPAIYRYRVNGGRGMSAVTYGKWVIQYDKKQTHFKVCVDVLREIYELNPTAKVLLFMPLIELCTECAYFVSKTLNYDEDFKYDLNVKTVNSHNSKGENEMNKHADVIVTTIQSLGTGSDIKGITDIICCSPMVSKISIQQVLGRIRYIDKPCHYYDIIDNSVPADMFWWKSRSKTLKRLTTKYSNRNWYEESGTDDKSI